MNQQQNQEREEQQQLELGGKAHNEQQTAQVQQENSQQIQADYPGALNTMMPTLRNNKDLVNFAYYLYKNQLVCEHQHNFEEWVGIRMRANFCNCAKWRSSYDAGMDTSRLEQMYSSNLWGGNYFDLLWARKENLSQNILDRCTGCAGNSGEDFPFCPYFLCHLIVKTAESYEASPEIIFDDILGSQKIPFRGRYIYPISQTIPVEEVQGIKAKSAYSAFLLLADQLVKAQSLDEYTVQYTHVPLCRGDQKTSVVSDMIDFWNTGCGITCTLNAADKASFLYSKTEGCKKCGYEQCPHKLAAYFIHLGKKYHADPIDLAWHVTQMTPYAGLPLNDNYQFDKYLAGIQKAPMKEDSKAEFMRMIHFIAGRKVNSNIPFLPFNIALCAPDKEKAHEVIDLFFNALWHFDYFRCGQDNVVKKELYMSTLPFADLCDAYSQAKAGTIFVLHDVGLLVDEKCSFHANHHGFLKLMEDRKKEVISIVIGSKEEVSTFLAAYPAFKDKIFTKHLEMTTMDSDAIMEALEDKLTQTFTIPEETYQQLEQYIRLTYPSSPKKDMVYVEELYENLLFNHYNHDVNAIPELHRSDIPYTKPPRSEKEIFEEIDRLTGLANVKQELRNVNNLVKFNMKMGTNNKNAVNLHMVFTGNPGTGKTTVANLTAEILYSIGFIQENKVVVCSAKDLIGVYMGQTGPKTARMCERAYNGVLFIDEAYQLNPFTRNEADSYKEECIAELIQQMENHRDKLVVIFAGYSQEMEDFLERANTGLRSRIGKIIHFPDYSSTELFEIFEKTVKKNGLTLGEGAKIRALEIFNNAKKDAERFGNARYARNLYERSLLQHAAITANLDKDDPALRILQRDELTVPNN